MPRCLPAPTPRLRFDAGTALARASADSILMGTRLETIVKAAHVARATRRTIRQNLLWAVAYNATAVPLAATGILAPWMAAIGMSASSLLVVLNALRLRRRSFESVCRRRRSGTNKTNRGTFLRDSTMTILFLLIPLGLLLVTIAVGAFFWATRTGQFDDLDSPAWSVVLDDDRQPGRETEKARD